jgi:type II secretory ATPase GspE/PulE/Tfp pilus assembly ATPase PilB-like protein
MAYQEEIVDNEQSDYLNLEKMREILTSMKVKDSHVRIALQRASLTGEPLPKIMSDYGFLTGDQVAEAVSRLTEFDHFPSDKLDSIDPTLLAQYKLNAYRRFVPVGRAEDGALLVAIPDDSVVNAAMNEFYKERTRFVIASEHTVQTIYRKYFAQTEVAFDHAVNKFMEASKGAGRNGEEDSGLVREVFGCLLRHVCYSGASDLYLYKSEHVGVIKLKINGVGILFRSIDPEMFDRLLNKLVTDNSKVDDLRKEPQESVLEFQGEDNRLFEDITSRFRFRLELTESRGIRNAVIRVLDKQSAATQLKKLDFDDHTYNAILRMSNAATGLIIVTGPTGSGKTTTLYAMLKSIDPVERSIQSIENPVEYRHGLWQQYEIRKDAENEGEEFNKWLKALLRNAPDVILMGEVRDKEVAQILLDAANTGHLAFTTLHTNTAALALARLKRLEVDQQTLASVLLGILAQRLVRVLCPQCKIPDTSEDTMLEMAEAREYLTSPPHAHRQGSGCPNCDYTGYRGRRIIYELLQVNAEIRKLIEDGSAPSTIGKKGIAPGSTMWANGMRLVAEGHTSFDEVRRVALKE